MPRRTQGRRLFAESHLAERLRIEREARGWTYAGLEKRTDEAGCKIASSALWKIENPTEPAKPRRITVDELVVLSRVFAVPMADLVTDPEALLPNHLTNLAERAAASLTAAYRLSQEAEEEEEAARDLLGELRASLADRPDLAALVIERLEQTHPAWVVGVEEHVMATSVVDDIRRSASAQLPKEGGSTHG